MPRKFIKWLTAARAGAGPGRILKEGSQHKDRVLGGVDRSSIVKTHQSIPQKSGIEQRPLGDNKWAREGLHNGNQVHLEVGTEI